MSAHPHPLGRATVEAGGAASEPLASAATPVPSAGVPEPDSWRPRVESRPDRARLRGSAAPGPRTPDWLRLPIIPPVLLATLFLLVNLVGIDRAPIVWVDEVTLNDAARELAWHGALRSPILTGTPTLEQAKFTGTASFMEAYYWQPPVQALTTAAMYKLAGFGIWQTRLVGLLAAAGAVGCLYLLGRELFGSRLAGLIAASVLALDPPFVMIARSGRMDSECLLLALVGLMLLWRWGQGERGVDRWLTGAGLAVGLATVTHPVALAWVLVGLALILASGGRRSWRAAVVFVGLAGLPGLLWVGWALRTPELFAAQFLHHGQVHMAEQSVPVRVWDEVRRSVEAYRRVPLLLMAYLAALAATLGGRWAGPRARLWVATITLVPFLFNALLMTKDVGYYYLHPVLGLALAAGGAGAWLIGRLPARGRGWRVLAAAVSCCVAANVLVMGTGGRLLTLATQWKERDYATIARPIRQAIPPDSTVWGPTEVWYAVEWAGADLRLLGAPDAAVDDFAIIRWGEAPPPGFEPVLNIGEPFPAVLGRFQPETYDYRFTITRSTRRAGG